MKTEWLWLFDQYKDERGLLESEVTALNRFIDKVKGDFSEAREYLVGQIGKIADLDKQAMFLYADALNCPAVFEHDWRTSWQQQEYLFIVYPTIQVVRFITQDNDKIAFQLEGKLIVESTSQRARFALELKDWNIFTDIRKYSVPF